MSRFTMSWLARVFVVSGVVYFGWTVAANADLITTDGDFNSQTIGSTTMSSPWYGSGSGHVISSDAQSPFTNLFTPTNGKGVRQDGSIGVYAGYYVQSFAGVVADATGSLYLNVDFRNITNDSGQDACYDLLIATNADGAKATAGLYIGKDGVYARSSTGYGTSLLTPEVNVWYNAQLTLDLTSNTYSGVITKQGGAQTVISSRGFITENAINTVFMNCPGPIAPFPTWPAAIPNFDIDNFAVSNTPIPGVPEPGTLVLLCGGLVSLLAYAWRKQK